MFQFRRVSIGGLPCALAGLPPEAAAQPAESIDHLNIHVAGTAGGGIDAYARPLGRVAWAKAPFNTIDDAKK